MAVRIAIFGGSFNPIHKGHINFCIECQRQYNFDKILIIPANIPPHKASDEMLSGDDRYKMAQLAIGDYDFLQMCDIEFKLGGKSYTIDTIEEILRDCKDAVLYLLIGSDMLLTFDKWHRCEQILKKTTVVAAARKDQDKEKLFFKQDSFGALSKKIEIVDIDVFDVSSTEIREKLKNNQNVSGLLDLKVIEYIKKNHLYE